VQVADAAGVIEDDSRDVVRVHVTPPQCTSGAVAFTGVTFETVPSGFTLV
jgi:hypothetical protein